MGNSRDATAFPHALFIGFRKTSAPYFYKRGDALGKSVSGNGD